MVEASIKRKNDAANYECGKMHDRAVHATISYGSERREVRVTMGRTHETSGEIGTDLSSLAAEVELG